KERCHQGHSVSKEPIFGEFYCDCGAGLDGVNCKALQKSDVSNNFMEEYKMLLDRELQSQRVFTIGIGREVSYTLINRVAKAGRGKSEFVVPGERLESKVIRLLRLSMQPYVESVKV